MNVLPTAVAYAHAYLSCPPKAGDRQVAKTYFDDGASKEWQLEQGGLPAGDQVRCLVRGAKLAKRPTTRKPASRCRRLRARCRSIPTTARPGSTCDVARAGHLLRRRRKGVGDVLQFAPNIQGIEAANLYAEKLYDVAKAAIHYKRVIGLNPDPKR